MRRPKCKGQRKTEEQFEKQQQSPSTATHRVVTSYNDHMSRDKKHICMDIAFSGQAKTYHLQTA